MLFPSVWESLSPEARQFYVRLSMRHIPSLGKRPSSFHWDVSKRLSELELEHRNAFRFGPYRIDVGLERLVSEDRRDCLMVDHQTSFYFGTNQYTRIRKLQHQILFHLGWNVRHVRADEWYNFEPSQKKEKARFLLDILNCKPSEFLMDKPEVGTREVMRAVNNKKTYEEKIKLGRIRWRERNISEKGGNGGKIEIEF